MENKFIASGWAFTIFGALNLLGFLVAYPFFTRVLTSFDGLKVLILALIYASMVVSFLALLSGIYLLRNNENVHKIALPVSIAVMLNIPFGTAVGALYLWQRHEHFK